MNPEDMNTIREILLDAEVDSFLDSEQFETLVAALELRENVMVIDGADTARKNLARTLKDKFDSIAKGL